VRPDDPRPARPGRDDAGDQEAAGVVPYPGRERHNLQNWLPGELPSHVSPLAVTLVTVSE
jgi:hypothetical protein